MNHTTLKHKIWIGLATGLVAGAVFRRLTFKYFSPWVPTPLLLGTSILMVLLGLVIPLIWHVSEKNHKSKYQSALEKILLYSLALDLSMFGWHKIEHLQMIVPLGILDTPFSSFSGERLVWAFFRHSYPYMVSIAMMQIGIAVLLLIPRTRLCGLLFAVPMLVFISSLDFFYELPVGVLIHGLILLMGVFCLISQDEKGLLEFLFRPKAAMVQASGFARSLLPLSLFIWPLLFHAIYKHPNLHPALTGTYDVKNLKVDGEAMKAQTPKDSVLTRVYLDLEDEVALDFNDYRYRYIGKYDFNEKNDSIRIHWRYPNDTIAMFEGKLTAVNGGLQLKGVMGDQRYQMDLLRTTASTGK